MPVPTIKKEPEFEPMYVGETVNFTCDVAVATDWQYQWLRDGVGLDQTSKTISIDLRDSTAGRYSCEASRGRMISTEATGGITQEAKSKY